MFIFSLNVSVSTLIAKPFYNPQMLKNNYVNALVDTDFVLENTLKMNFERNQATELNYFIKQTSAATSSDTATTNAVSMERMGWGFKYTFHTDLAANNFVKNLRNVSRVNFAFGIILAMLGPIAIPAFLGGIWAYSLADNIEYQASKPGEGVILNLQYIPTYSVEPANF